MAEDRRYFAHVDRHHQQQQVRSNKKSIFFDDDDDEHNSTGGGHKEEGRYFGDCYGGIRSKPLLGIRTAHFRSIVGGTVAILIIVSALQIRTYHSYSSSTLLHPSSEAISNNLLSLSASAPMLRQAQNSTPWTELSGVLPRDEVPDKDLLLPASDPPSVGIFRSSAEDRVAEVDQVLNTIDNYAMTERPDQNDEEEEDHVMVSSCEVPPGFPDTPPATAEDLGVCGKTEIFDAHCNTTDCSCIINAADSSQEFRDFYAAYHDPVRMGDRRAKLYELLGGTPPLPERFITVIAVSYGYMFLFMNWLCSVTENGILRSSSSSYTTTTAAMQTDFLLVIDRKSEESIIGLRSSGLHFPYIIAEDWYFPTVTVPSDTPKFFAQGAFRYFIMSQVALTNDLVQLGYNVVIQDVDVAWKKDPRLSFQRELQALSARGRVDGYFDVQMSFDGRQDYMGPGNSGFYVVQSNCRTRVLFSTIAKYFHFVWSRNCDQSVINGMILRSRFRGYIRFRLLPSAQFVNGHQFTTTKRTYEDDPNIEYTVDTPFTLHDATVDSLSVVHASWTGPWQAKVAKFRSIGMWYYSAESCPDFYDRRLDVTLLTKSSNNTSD